MLVAMTAAPLRGFLVCLAAALKAGLSVKYKIGLDTLVLFRLFDWPVSLAYFLELLDTSQVFQMLECNFLWAGAISVITVLPVSKQKLHVLYCK